MTGEDELRTLTLTYRAQDQEEAEVFATVIGSMAENFGGVILHEVVDETVFPDRDDHGAVDAMLEALLEVGRLAHAQVEQLDRFGSELRAWQIGNDRADEDR
jgi:hypothetical protein